MKENQKGDAEQVHLEHFQTQAKFTLFKVCNCYLKFCQELNENIYYLFTIIETLQFLWFTTHPTFTFLGQPILLNYFNIVTSLLNFQWYTRQNTSAGAFFIIIVFSITIAYLLLLSVSIICIIKGFESQIVKAFHKFASISFLAMNTILVIPFFNIAGIMLYCTNDSPYHQGRQCYAGIHIGFIIMAVVIIISLLINSVVYCLLFTMKNPFCRSFLACPQSLWRWAKLAIKIVPPLYFIIDQSQNYLQVYLFLVVIAIGGYIFFFRLFSLHNYNQKHFYFIFGSEIVIMWFSINNIINFYLNDGKIGGLYFLESCLVCIIALYLMITIEKVTDEKGFIQNLMEKKIKKQNIEKFLYTLIYYIAQISNNQCRKAIFMAVKLINSKAEVCNLRIAKLFRERDLKPEQQVSILYQFLSIITQTLKEENPSLPVLKVIRSHLLFMTNHKIMAIHSIMQVQSEKLSLVDQFMFYQFIRNYNVFNDDYQKDLKDQNNLVCVYYDFTQKLSHFQKSIYEASVNNKQYWEQIIQDSPSLLKLRDLADRFRNMSTTIRQKFFQLNQIFSNHVYTIQLYFEYLIYVGMDFKQLLAIIQKIQIDYNMKDQQQQNAQEELIKFKESENLGVITIETSNSTIGTVISCNKQVKKMLGYSKNDLIGSKINKIMPKVFNQIHDKFIKKFIEKEDSTAYPSEKVVFILNKQGTVTENALYIKIIPHEENGFNLVGFFKQIKRRGEKPAFAIISGKTFNLQAISKVFIDMVCLPIDFTNLSKEPVHISSLFPELNLEEFKKDNIIDATLAFSNYSEKGIQMQQNFSSQPQDFVIKVIDNRCFQTQQLIFIEMSEAKKPDEIAGSIYYRQSEHQEQAHKIKTCANISTDQVIQFLPEQRKIQDFIKHNVKNRLFLAMKIIIVLFLLAKISISVSQFILAANFDKQMMDIYGATNLTYCIVVSQGRINLLADKAQLERSYLTDIIKTEILSELKSNALVLKENTVLLMNFANQQNYPLNVNQNSFYPFIIVESSATTKNQIVSMQSYSDGLFQYISSAIQLSQKSVTDLSNVLYTQDEQINSYIQLNGVKLLPQIAGMTTNKINSQFEDLISSYNTLQLLFFFIQCPIILITFLIVIYALVTYNKFNIYTIQAYNNILLWDIHQLKSRCEKMLLNNFSEEYLQVQKQVIATGSDKTKIGANDDKLISLLPKNLLVSIIKQTEPDAVGQNSRLNLVNEQMSDSQEQEKLLKENSFNPDLVHLKQFKSLKKMVIFILVSMFILMGLTCGYYFMIRSYKSDFQNCQRDINLLGRIEKNMRFTLYYCFELIQKPDQTSLFTTLLQKQFQAFSTNSQQFYAAIGDPNPFLKSIYSQIEQLKHISNSPAGISSNNPIFQKAQQVLQENIVKLNDFSKTYMKENQQKLVVQFRGIYIVKIMLNIFATVALILVIYCCFVSSFSFVVKRSESMIRMIPFWLIKKNKKLSKYISEIK